MSLGADEDNDKKKKKNRDDDDGGGDSSDVYKTEEQLNIEAIKNEERIITIIEYPLIGFLLAQIYLNEDDWKVYAMYEYKTSQPNPDHTTVNILLGYNKKDHLFYTPVKTGYPYLGFYHPILPHKWSCIRKQSPEPKYITLGQKIFYTIYYPFSNNFASIVERDLYDWSKWSMLSYVLISFTGLPLILYILSIPCHVIACVLIFPSIGECIVL